MPREDETKPNVGRDRRGLTRRDGKVFRLARHQRSSGRFQQYEVYAGGRAFLWRPQPEVDTLSMHPPHFAQLDRNPNWRLLLTAYQARQVTSADGWVDRIFELENLDGDQLSKSHGRLIAIGLLDFEFSGRGDGMRYQLSPLGKQALNGPVSLDAETVTEEAEMV